jgi:hypothetical protein
MPRITKRDEALFAAIARYNFFTTKQIQENIFPNIKLTTVLRRLRKFEEVKYLRRIGFLESGMRVWSNSLLATQVFGGMPTASRVNLHTLQHDVILTDIRILLERIGKVSAWYDTRAIQGHHLEAPFNRDFVRDESPFHRREEQLIPDGLFLASSKGRSKPFSLELEYTHKSWQRYEKILRLYDKKICIQNPWFIAKTSAIAGRYLGLAKAKRGTSNRIFVTLLEDLLQHKSKAVVYCSDGTKLPLHEILDCNEFSPPTRRTTGSPTGHLGGQGLCAPPKNISS